MSHGILPTTSPGSLLEHEAGKRLATELHFYSSSRLPRARSRVPQLDASWEKNRLWFLSLRKAPSQQLRLAMGTHYRQCRVKGRLLEALGLSKATVRKKTR